MITWNTPPPLDTDAAIHAREDQLRKQIAEAGFDPPHGVDAGAAELLRPAEPLPGQASLPASSAMQGQGRLDQAGPGETIPTFEDQPDDRPATNVPPVDVEAERAAWQQLLEFVNQHKDPGATITMVDLATFTKGLA